MEQEKKPLLKITALRKKQLIVGFCLIVAGFFMPIIVNRQLIPVDKFYTLAMQEERRLLLSAALLVTLTNVLLALPHYVGVYWVTDSLQIRYRGRAEIRANEALVVILLLATYLLIDIITGVHYYLGLPAVLMTAILMLYEHLQYRYVSLMKRTLLVIVSLAALQFLDVMPAAGDLAIGRDNMSHIIKAAARTLQLEREMNFLALICFFLLVLIAIIILFLLRDENRLLEANRLREINARMQMEAFELEVQNRTLKETQYLVHDLKSPLSVVQTLEGVLRFKSEINHTEDPETFNRMEKALDQMSSRISQLLTMDQKESFTVEELLRDVMAKISIENYAPHVSVETELPQEVLYANQGLLCRALINLINNAVQAVPEDRIPAIRLMAHREGAYVVLAVRDNGKGVTSDMQGTIWNDGVSGKGSTGLGLAFVKSVAHRFGGHVRIESEPGKGTVIAMWIPEEEKNHDP